MNEEDTLQLFMPIIVASLTNAVYTCQLLDPEMKQNPEAAIQHVLLTSERIQSILSKPFVQSASKNLQLSQKIANLLFDEIRQMQERSQYLASCDPTLQTPETVEEMKSLAVKAQVLQRVSEIFLQASQ